MALVILSAAPSFQQYNFDPGIPRHKSTAMWTNVRSMEMDASAFFAQFREELRRELEEILES